MRRLFMKLRQEDTIFHILGPFDWACQFVRERR